MNFGGKSKGSMIDFPVSVVVLIIPLFVGSLVGAMVIQEMHDRNDNGDGIFGDFGDKIFDKTLGLYSIIDKGIVFSVMSLAFIAFVKAREVSMSPILIPVGLLFIAPASFILAEMANFVYTLLLADMFASAANYFTATAFLFKHLVEIGVVFMLVILGLMVFKKRQQTAGGL